MSGLEIAKPDRDAVVGNAVAEDVERSATVELLHKAGKEPFLQLVAVDAAKFGPLLGLAIPQKHEQLRGVQRKLPIPVVRVALDPAALRQLTRDVCLEGSFEMNSGHYATSRMSSWPVTAAVMTA